LFDGLPLVPPALVPTVEPAELAPELPQPTMNPQPATAINNSITLRLIMDPSSSGN
jgi:hypothetical protein